MTRPVHPPELDWPFFEARHRDFKVRLDAWCAQHLATHESEQDRASVDQACLHLVRLLGQGGWERLARETVGAQLLSSVLLVLEARRNLVRLARETRLTPQQYEMCAGRLAQDAELFHFRDLTLDICQSNALPAVATPRSFDLVHLRTALWFHARRGEERRRPAITLPEAR